MKAIVNHPVKSVVAFYDAHQQAENAIMTLHKNGVGLSLFTIVALDLYTSEKVLGYYNTGDRMKKWAISGGFWAGFWGLLFGFSTYSIPIIGPALIQGWLGALIAGVVVALFGAVVGGIAAAIYSSLLPKHKKIKYQTAVKAGRYMLLAQANELEIEHFLEILQLHAPKKRHDAADWRSGKQPQLRIK